MDTLERSFTSVFSDVSGQMLRSGEGHVAVWVSLALECSSFRLLSGGRLLLSCSVHGGV